MTKQINTIKLAEHITNKRLHSSSTTPIWTKNQKPSSMRSLTCLRKSRLDGFFISIQKSRPKAAVILLIKKILMCSCSGKNQNKFFFYYFVY